MSPPNPNVVMTEHFLVLDANIVHLSIRPVAVTVRNNSDGGVALAPSRGGGGSRCLFLFPSSLSHSVLSCAAFELQPTVLSLTKVELSDIPSTETLICIFLSSLLYNCNFGGLFCRLINECPISKVIQRSSEEREINFLLR